MPVAPKSMILIDASTSRLTSTEKACGSRLRARRAGVAHLGRLGAWRRLERVQQARQRLGMRQQRARGSACRRRSRSASSERSRRRSRPRYPHGPRCRPRRSGISDARAPPARTAAGIRGRRRTIRRTGKRPTADRRRVSGVEMKVGQGQFGRLRNRGGVRRHYRFASRSCRRSPIQRAFAARGCERRGRAACSSSRSNGSSGVAAGRPAACSACPPRPRSSATGPSSRAPPAFPAPVRAAARRPRMPATSCGAPSPRRRRGACAAQFAAAPPAPAGTASRAAPPRRRHAGQEARQVGRDHRAQQHDDPGHVDPDQQDGHGREGAVHAPNRWAPCRGRAPARAWQSRSPTAANKPPAQACARCTGVFGT